MSTPIKGSVVASNEVMRQNSRGQWVPAIPFPFIRSLPPRFRCECGRKFWTRAGYAGHFVLVHVMGVES